MRSGQYLDYLAATPAEYGDPLEDPHAHDYAARDFKTHLKTVRKAKPSSVNLSLAAVDNFYRFLGMGKPEVRREELPGAAPKALTPEEQKKFLRAVERSSEVRDRTIALLLFVRRLGEEAALDEPLSAHALRHTCMTNLVRAGYDLVLVAEIAGHKRLETTRRYSLPSAADREAAMESIRVEY